MCGVRCRCGKGATAPPILRATLPITHFLRRIFHTNVAYGLNRSCAREGANLPFRDRNRHEKIAANLDYVVLFVAVAGSGVAYAFLEYGGGALIGATYALFACAPILAFERGYIMPGLSRQVSALPTPAYIAVGLLIYAILVFCGFGLGGTILWLSGIFPGTWKRAVHAEVQTLVFTLIVCGIIVFIMRVRELLGRDIFIDLILGAIAAPVSEDRVFIFIDLVGSTSFAETHGT